MGLLKSWGIGAELTFKADRARLEITDTKGKIQQLRASLGSLKDAGRTAASGIGQIVTALAPLGLATGAALGIGSKLAADLEASQLTMRVMVGDADKAARLLAMVRENAASTPFAEGDLIEGSKRLLRLTGDNVDRNMELLKLTETMAALNPTKNVTDAVEAVLDAAGGGGFERLKEFGLALNADMFSDTGRAGGAAWGEAVVAQLQATMQERTKGADLVGELSRTFSGRLSTLKDAISNTLRGVGVELNAAVGPVLEPITAWITKQRPIIVGAFQGLLERARPVLTVIGGAIRRIAGAWDSLPESTRSTILQVGMAMGVAAAVVLPLAAGLAGLVTAGAGVVAVFSAAGPAISGVMGVISTVGMPAIMGWLALLGKVTAAGGIGALLGGGEILTTLGSAFSMLGTWLSTAYTWTMTLAGAYYRGLLPALAPIWEVITTQLQPAFQGILKAFQDVFGELSTGTVSAGEFTGMVETVGAWVGWLASTALVPLLEGVGMLIRGFQFVMELAAPMIRHVKRIGVAFLGLAQGTLSVREAFTLVVSSWVRTAVEGVRSLVRFLVSTLGTVLTRMAAVVAKVPGASGIANRIRGAAVTASQLGEGLDRELGRLSAEADRKAAQLEARRADRAAPTVNVQTGDTVVEAKVETKTCVDGREIGRASGKVAMRSGQRGTGPRVEASRTGRVLRGSVVGALQPAEVVSGG